MFSCHEPSLEDMSRGAYVAIEPHHGLADGVMFCGEKDFPLLKKAAAILSVQGLALQLCVIRDFDLFSKQEKQYQSHVLRPDLKGIEVSDSLCPWHGKAAVLHISPDTPEDMARAIFGLITQ